MATTSKEKNVAPWYAWTNGTTHYDFLDWFIAKQHEPWIMDKLGLEMLKGSRAQDENYQYYTNYNLQPHTGRRAYQVCRKPVSKKAWEWHNNQLAIQAERKRRQEQTQAEMDAENGQSEFEEEDQQQQKTLTEVLTDKYPKAFTAEETSTKELTAAIDRLTIAITKLALRQK